MASHKRSILDSWIRSGDRGQIKGKLLDDTFGSTIFAVKMVIYVRHVWNDNLEDEFAQLQETHSNYPCTAINVNFTRTALPMGIYCTSSDDHYHNLKDTIDLMLLNQIGFCLFDDKGNLPTCGTDKPCIWQFNITSGNYSIGIDPVRFGELLMSSGVVCDRDGDGDVVTFQGGYNLGYLLRILRGEDLPNTQTEFLELVKAFFPKVYDIKHIMGFYYGLHNGLEKVADLLGVERISINNQAGWDSLLTSRVFQRMKESFFNGSTEIYAGGLYGLGDYN